MTTDDSHHLLLNLPAGTYARLCAFCEGLAITPEALASRIVAELVDLARQRLPSTQGAADA